MDIFNESTIKFITLMSPAFVAYIFFKKIKNEDINTNINLPMIICLIALDIVVLGISNLIISIIEFFSQVINYYFPSLLNGKIYVIIVATLLILGIIFIYCSSKRNKVIRTRIATGLIFLSVSYLLELIEDKEMPSYLLCLDKPVMELKYFEKKFFINPIAIFLHSFYSLVILHILDTKTIPFLRKLFYSKIENNNQIKTKTKIKTKEIRRK